MKTLHQIQSALAEQPYTELLLGCGHSREKRLGREDKPGWHYLVTLDRNENCKPDVLHDLNDWCLPFRQNSFDEIHAYEVLEHTGTQGDAEFFFRQWGSFWHALKPGGFFFGTVPNYRSPWAFGDPSHSRVIPLESLTFLSQAEYERQLGKTAMSDFRRIWRGDFEVVQAAYVDEHQARFILKAIK